MTRFLNIIALSLLSITSLEAGKCKHKEPVKAQLFLATPNLLAQKLAPQEVYITTTAQAYPSSTPAPTTTTKAYPVFTPTTTTQAYPVSTPSGNPEIINKQGCNLPSDSNITPVTPGSLNAGWAMSPDQACSPGTWCPYACKPGMYSTQWDPNAKCPTGSGCNTMNGGLYCDANKKLVIPKPDVPLCKYGLQNSFVQNQLSGSVGICQTVYPGNEAMLIPTVANAGSTQMILTPPSNYWLGTSAHYYVNFPGTNGNDCVWGTNSNPVGNWSPFVIGSNEGYQDNTFVMANVNPEFVKQNFHKDGSLQHYSITIKCQTAGCNNDGCTVSSRDSDKMCVTTVPAGGKVNFVLSK